MYLPFIVCKVTWEKIQFSSHTKEQGGFPHVSVGGRTCQW